MSEFNWKFHRLRPSTAYDLGLFRVRKGYDLEFPHANVMVAPQEDGTWSVGGRIFLRWDAPMDYDEERFEQVGFASSDDAKTAAEAWIIMLKLQGKI